MNAMINLSDEQHDLVARLREYYTEDDWRFEVKHPICDEAADEIERLRQEIAAGKAWRNQLVAAGVL